MSICSESNTIYQKFAFTVKFDVLFNEVFLISFSDKITSSSETFGEQEAVELMDILTQYLGMAGDVLLK